MVLKIYMGAGEDVTHLVECMPSTGKALGSVLNRRLAWRNTTVVLALGRWESRRSRLFLATYGI